jgi:hypothetical protein
MGCIGKGRKADPKRRAKEKFDLPEFGDGAYVWVRALGSADLRDMQDRFGKAGDTANLDFMYECLRRGLVDDAGELLYETGEDAAAALDLDLKRLEELTKSLFVLSGVPYKEADEKN